MNILSQKKQYSKQFAVLTTIFKYVKILKRGLKMTDEVKKFNETFNNLFDFFLETDFPDKKMESYFVRSVSYDLGELSGVFYKKFYDENIDYYACYYPFIDNMYKKAQLYEKISKSNGSLNMLINGFKHIDESFKVPLSAEKQAKHFLSLQQSYYQQLKSEVFDEIIYAKVVDEEKVIDYFRK